ncbi:MAG: acyl-CoA thioesterase [Bacteroidia bacterium]|jgi:acyl-CoA thioester hydrolase/thioesterase-3|nr:acyl-CoA thioesterase [Bacteroidia bacterium]
MQINNNTYETELQVRPDDIDMFMHVHSSRYMDYVLAARFDQMERCYHNPMSIYFEKGLGWVINTCHMQFKRALKLGDSMLVSTRLTEIRKADVTVEFAIKNKLTGKICCDGYFNYTLINLATQKAEIIPDWVMDAYTLK